MLTENMHSEISIPYTPQSTVAFEHLIQNIQNYLSYKLKIGALRIFFKKIPLQDIGKLL